MNLDVNTLFLVTIYVEAVLGLLLLFGWTLAFFYHLANGVRHLAWDAGYGFELKAVYASGWAVVAVAAVLTVASWIAGYWMMGAFG